MKRYTTTLFGYKIVVSFGIITMQDVEEAVRDAILRVHKKDLNWNEASWFQVQTLFNYHYKQIKIIDFTGSFESTVYENSEDNIEELLYKAKKHFDAIK